jgi:hypothetical protein
MVAKQIEAEGAEVNDALPPIPRISLIFSAFAGWKKSRPAGVPEARSACAPALVRTIRLCH